MGSTIRDVAQRAGVSISTVSRVLNKTASVSEAKRRRVTEAVRVLGYTPNPAAISLLKRATSTIGVVLPYISGEFFAELLRGLDDTVQEYGYLLMVSAWHRNAQEFRAALQSMYRRVDGLLVMAPGLTTALESELIEEGCPVVCINTPVTEGQCDVFNFDNYGGMYALTRHLVERGHTRIAFITGPNTERDAQDRLHGYRDAVTHCGGDQSKKLEFAGNFSVECGYEAASKILDMDPRPTAIIGANDQSAQGALRHLLYSGIRIPEDISVAGFDGIPSTRYSTPTLTTVHVPIRGIAVRAIHHLLRLLSNEKSPGGHVHVLPLEIVIRESTGPSPHI